MKAPRSLELQWFADLETNPRKDWLVRDLLGIGELSCLFGPPGGAKSLLACDLACHVAADRPWFGRRVMTGAVLYVAAERGALVKRRLAAWRLHYGISDLPLAVVSGSFDLRSSSADAAAIVSTAEEMRQATSLDVRLIQIDTVSRVLAGGDENGPRDMGALVHNLAQIQLRTRAHVMALHHIPIDGQQRMRGHGALLGACDTTIGVEKAAGGLRTATVHKQNDGPEGERLGFDIESVELSVDPDTGDPTTAPVAVPVEGDIPKSPPKRKLSDKQQRALEVLQNITLEAGKEPPMGLNLPAGIKVVTVEEWRTGLARHGVVNGEDANPREAFKRIRLSLTARRVIGECDAMVWAVR